MPGNDAALCREPPAAQRTLGELGYDAQDLAEIRRILQQPDGIVLAVGPAGSGRTASLHAMLEAIAPQCRRIRTVEDTVPRRRPGWLQGEGGDPDDGRGHDPLAARFRRLLRSRPDALLLAEIDSSEAAQLVLRAAQAGCRVFSALHGGRAHHVFPRFRAWGVAATDLADHLGLVVAQRLVRALCRHCSLPDDSEAVRDALVRAAEGWRSPPAARASVQARMVNPGGCKHCRGDGYRGHVLVYEWIEVDSGVRSLVEEGVGATEMERRLLADGRSLWERGLRLVASGATSLGALRASVREPR